MAWSIKDCVEGEQSAWVATRSRTVAKAMENTGKAEEAATSEGVASRDPPGAEPDDPPLLVEVTDENDDEELEGLEQMEEYWGAHNPPPNIHIAMDPDFQRKFVAAYLADPAFGPIWSNPRSDEGAWTPEYRYFKNQDGLLFFRDTDYQPRLCVPREHQKFLMQEIHESPFETVHAGPRKIWISSYGQINPLNGGSIPQV
jgi:hypothetical protein